MESWYPVPLARPCAAARQAEFVGRRYELEVLEHIWSDVQEHKPQLLLVGGEPGAGKTRLVLEAAASLHAHGSTVLAGTATKDSGIPFQPFAELLDQFFRDCPPGSLGDLLQPDSAALHRLSPSLERHLPRSAGQLATEQRGGARRELFDAVCSLLTALAREHPLVLVLDDLHWAQLPTIPLLEQVMRSGRGNRLLILATFRTTAPDRSEELSARLADLHRLDGVRRIDLGGLDTEAIAEFVSRRTGGSVEQVRASAAILRDRTGGNPFFLHELWNDLERLGGLPALRVPHRVPASIGDTIGARLAGMGRHQRETLELAAVLGQTVELATLAGASTDAQQCLDAIDVAVALGLLEAVDDEPGRYRFVHSLTRQAVLDRLPNARRTLWHARAAAALEAHRDDPLVIPQLAYHYLAAQVLGNQAAALHFARLAAQGAARALGYEEAARWFERAAELAEITSADRVECQFGAASNYVRSGEFAHARVIYERLCSALDPQVRLGAAIGYEDANWRPGVPGTRAADLLCAAIDDCGLDPEDPRYAVALGSLGRALAFAGRPAQAREVGSRAIAIARRAGRPDDLRHTLKTSLWHGLTPDIAHTQFERARELSALCRAADDHETLGSAAYFRAMVSYLVGEPDDLYAATADMQQAARTTGQPFFAYVADCVSQGIAFMHGDFARARSLAQATLQTGMGFDDATEGPYGVQMYMINRETGGLAAARGQVSGRESFGGRWTAGLLALYTELGLAEGVQRALHALLRRDLTAHATEAQWPIELAFMVEAALASADREAAAQLEPFVLAYAGKNIVGGQFVAVFGSADRYLARLAALRGDLAVAEERFAAAAVLDRRMGSAVHTAETLAHHARMLRTLDPARAADLARQARELAEPNGHQRVLALLGGGAGVDSLTEREVEVLRLVAEGLSNREIAGRLHISANTAANHVRSILLKTGTANRTRAARYAADRDLV